MGERRVHAHQLMCAPHSQPWGRSMSLVFGVSQEQGNRSLVTWTHQARSTGAVSCPAFTCVFPSLWNDSLVPSPCSFCRCLGRDQTCSIMQKTRGNLFISRAKKALTNVTTTSRLGTLTGPHGGPWSSKDGEEDLTRD